MVNRKLRNQIKNFKYTELRLVREKKVIGSFYPNKVIKSIKKVLVFNKAANEVSKKNKRICRRFLITAALVFPTTIITTGLAQSHVPLLFGGPALFILFSLSFFYYYRSNRLQSVAYLENCKDFLFPLLTLMNEEMLPNTKIDLEFDGRSPLHRAFFKEKKFGIWFFKPGYVNYNQQWLKGKLTFCDQTKLLFEIEKFVSQIKTTKVRKSGKIKTKVKDKTWELIRLKMVVPKEKYIRSKKKSTIIKISEDHKSFIIKGKFKYKRKSIATIPLSRFIKTIHRMYAILKPVTQNGKLSI